MPVSLLVPTTSVSEQFRSDVISKFWDDEDGRICLTDPTIIQVGSRLFDKLRKKNDNQVEVKKSVRTDMWCLAQLYVGFTDSIMRSIMIHCLKPFNMLYNCIT